MCFHMVELHIFEIRLNHNIFAMYSYVDYTHNNFYDKLAPNPASIRDNKMIILCAGITCFKHTMGRQAGT